MKSKKNVKFQLKVLILWYFHLDFADEDLEPNQMISLKGFDEIQVFGSVVNAECTLSAYYGSATFQFALEVDGGKLEFLPCNFSNIPSYPISTHEVLCMHIIFH